MYQRVIQSVLTAQWYYPFRCVKVIHQCLSHLLLPLYSRIHIKSMQFMFHSKWHFLILYNTKFSLHYKVHCIFSTQWRIKSSVTTALISKGQWLDSLFHGKCCRPKPIKQVRVIWSKVSLILPPLCDFLQWRNSKTRLQPRALLIFLSASFSKPSACWNT